MNTLLALSARPLIRDIGILLLFSVGGLMLSMALPGGPEVVAVLGAY
jgi:hypothetical protein